MTGFNPHNPGSFLRRYRTWIPALALATFGLFVASCSFEPGVSPAIECAVRGDCPPGYECRDGVCQKGQGSTDMTTPDAGGGSSGDADLLPEMGADDAGGNPDLSSDPGPDASGDAPGDASATCETDDDGDGFKTGSGCALAELDCDDSDADVYPGAPTLCDGKDNDCDGSVDDQGCECVNGFMTSCGSGIGLCQPGTKRCSGGQWGDCTGGVGPAPEVCDGDDNDCDGQIDEELTRACSTACGSGIEICEGGLWGSCSADAVEEEVCDGFDNDCDGQIDETFPGEGQACQTSLGTCGAGVLVCRSGTEVCETSSTGTTEVCDGVDNDCDGDVDETFPDDGQACSTGLPGACATGMWVCNGGMKTCEPATGGAEVCDGVDNDCDGQTDEATDGTVLTEECSGSCMATTVRICEGGAWSPCTHTEMEVCNGSDSNCDTQVDNQGVCYAVCPDGSLAPGTRTCGSGDSCTLPEEICGDGRDNDCDGQVDQGCNAGLDGMVFVPGGTFLMGSETNAPYTQSDETPLHIVELDPYYIDRTEVRRSDYASCVLNGACSTASFCTYQPTLTDGDKPIVCVSHSQARSYCAWRGKRLPSEAEWEKAARGPFDRIVLWPWGDQEDTSRGVFSCPDSANDCVVDVDSYPQGESYYGARHMAGNVAEWVRDYYDPTFYNSNYAINPVQTSDQGQGHVIRGGAYSQGIEFGRTANRAATSFLDDDEIGFRCARNAP